MVRIRGKCASKNITKHKRLKVDCMLEQLKTMEGNLARHLSISTIDKYSDDEEYATSDDDE